MARRFILRGRLLGAVSLAGLAAGLGIAGTAVASAQTPAAGPSFNCAAASGQVETLICRDADLAALDRRLAEVYAQALENLPAEDATRERTMQRGWISGRNECWTSDDLRACVETEYQTRITELQIRSGQLMVPMPVGYACTGGPNQNFTVVFYRDTETPSAVITYGDDQVIAFVAPSASGARYTAANVEFWEHQGEATVDWFGTSLTCRPLTAPQFSLGGSAWTLVELRSMDDTVLRPTGDERFTLAFDDDGSVAVQADCNRGRGAWQVGDAGGTLALGPFTLTRAMCPSALSQRFVSDLENVVSYRVTDGHLFLSLRMDGGIYSFEPLVSPVQ